MTHTSPFRWYLGHRCIRVLALLSEILEALRVLVVEAVGVGTGRAMAAALAAGAAAVPVGTRFVTADAAGAHTVYLNALTAAIAIDATHPTQ
jgi:NAD(P)H-dependent flavin oxidoreductase YrpB (nitropropane dioxygenase family)